MDSVATGCKRGSMAVSRRRQLVADAALLFVTAVWGATFVMVQDAVSSYPVFAFLALRFTLATLVLLPFSLGHRKRSAGGRGAGSGSPEGLQSAFVDQAGWPLTRQRLRRHRRTASAPVSGHGNRPEEEPQSKFSETLFTALAPGVLIGLALFAGYAFQTFGLRYTTAAKAGFITGLSVVMVPLGQALFLRRGPERGPVAGVVLATFGLGLLSLQANLSVGLGDLLVLACAVGFASHILLVGRFAPDRQPLQLALVQIATVAVLSSAAALTVERPSAWPAGNVWFAAAFTGVLATSLAFFLQSRAQQATTPTHTALIFAAEPVFAGIFSFLLIGEVLGPRQVVGGLLILAGMLAAELGNRMTT